MNFEHWWLSRRRHVADVLLHLAAFVAPPRTPVFLQAREGKWVRFSAIGARLGEPRWVVLAQKGHFELGWIEYSPQWRAYRFVPHPEAIFSGGVIAEIYSFLKERGVQTGRFV